MAEATFAGITCDVYLSAVNPISLSCTDLLVRCTLSKAEARLLVSRAKPGKVVAITVGGLESPETYSCTVKSCDKTAKDIANDTREGLIEVTTIVVPIFEPPQESKP